MRHFLQPFFGNFPKTPKRGHLLEKLQGFPKSMIFRVFSRIEAGQKGHVMNPNEVLCVVFLKGQTDF